jgi:ABC-type Fe3+ transport system permease subunit
MTRVFKKILKKRYGVAQAILVFLLGIIILALLYIPLNYGVQQFQYLQSSIWNNGIFDPDTLVFISTYWTWFPIFSFFILIMYVFMKAQKRKWGE